MKYSRLNSSIFLFSLLISTITTALTKISDCDLPTVNNSYEFTKTATLEGISAKKLYHATNITLIEFFKVVEEPIKYQNKELGVIMATAPIRISFKLTFTEPEHYFGFLLRFDFREGRYRLKATYIDHESLSGDSFCSCENDIVHQKCGTFACTTPREWATVRCQAHEELLKTLAGLELKIQENVKSLVINEEW